MAEQRIAPVDFIRVDFYFVIKKKTKRNFRKTLNGKKNVSCNINILVYKIINAVAYSRHCKIIKNEKSIEELK